MGHHSLHTSYRAQDRLSNYRSSTNSTTNTSSNTCSNPSWRTTTSVSSMSAGAQLRDHQRPGGIGFCTDTAQTLLLRVRRSGNHAGLRAQCQDQSERQPDHPGHRADLLRLRRRFARGAGLQVANRGDHRQNRHQPVGRGLTFPPQEQP